MPVNRIISTYCFNVSKCHLITAENEFKQHVKSIYNVFPNSVFQQAYTWVTRTEHVRIYAAIILTVKKCVKSFAGTGN